jgi:hypothetical protein
VRLTPKLKPYLRRSTPTWPDIIDAADWLRHDLGVSQSLWGDACLAMGRELAAVALAVVSTKDEEHFRTSPGGYFHGMVAKAKTGELHLERTIWALRRAAEPDRAAGRPGTSDRGEGAPGVVSKLNSALRAPSNHGVLCSYGRRAWPAGSPTTGHTGPYHGGSTGLSLGRDMESGETRATGAA